MSTMVFQLCSLSCAQSSMDILINLDPPAPTNVRAVRITSHSIEVKWDQSSSSDVTGYIISYNATDSHSSSDRMSVNGGSATSHTLTNMKENTSYIVTVQATTSDNRMSADSNEVLVRTYTDGK